MDCASIPHVLCLQLFLYLASVSNFFVKVLEANFFFGGNDTEFNDYNGALFTIRARGLNNFVYWTAQIFGSLFIGYVILDQKGYRRRVRAFVGWVIVLIMVFVVHIWAYFYQR